MKNNKYRIIETHFGIKIKRDGAKQLRLECANQGVPYFFKQIDKVKPIPESYLVRQLPFDEKA